MATLNQYNGISIFAQGATESNIEQHDESIGYYYPDSTWKTLNDRTVGAREGIAYSIDYNTAIRQATVISSVLTEMMVLRNTDSNAYKYMAENGIGTKFDSSEGEGAEGIENHVVNLAAILNKDNFLMKGEVTTDKINDSAVTRQKISAYSVDYSKLGNILTTSGNASISATSNGMTVSLTQNGNQGNLNISFTGNSVINANNVNISTSTSKLYLTGSTATSGYNPLRVNSSIYSQAGNLYLTSCIATGYMQAQYFNATSDIRKKHDIKPLNEFEKIKNLIENTDIVSFKYNNSDETNVGIIAQDVDVDIDGFNLVSKDKDGYLMIKESKLIYLLWEYIKHLK